MHRQRAAWLPRRTALPPRDPFLLTPTLAARREPVMRGEDEAMLVPSDDNDEGCGTGSGADMPIMDGVRGWNAPAEAPSGGRPAVRGTSSGADGPGAPAPEWAQAASGAAARGSSDATASCGIIRSHWGQLRVVGPRGALPAKRHVGQRTKTKIPKDIDSSRRSAGRAHRVRPSCGCHGCIRPRVGGELLGGGERRVTDRLGKRNRLLGKPRRWDRGR